MYKKSVFIFLPFQNDGRFAGTFLSQGNALTNPHKISTLFYRTLLFFRNHLIEVVEEKSNL